MAERAGRRLMIVYPVFFFYLSFFFFFLQSLLYHSEHSRLCPLGPSKFVRLSFESFIFFVLSKVVGAQPGVQPSPRHLGGRDTSGHMLNSKGAPSPPPTSLASLQISIIRCIPSSVHT